MFLYHITHVHNIRATCTSTAIHNYYFMRYVYPAQLTQLIMRAQSLQLMESLPRSFHSKVYLYGNWEGVGGEGKVSL
jgi:hypothetical protein